MSKIYGYNEGDRSEFLAAFALSTIGFTVQVPRQADYFLVDFLVNIHRSRKRGGSRVLEPTGQTFAIQIKSNKKSIKVENESQRQAFFQSMTPFFIGVVDKKNGILSIYTTISRLLWSWTANERDLTLKFGSTWDRVLLPDRESIGLGDPIIQIELAKLDSTTKAVKTNERDILNKVASWVKLESMVITSRLQGTPWIRLPYSIQTNADLDWSQLECIPVPNIGLLKYSTSSLRRNLQAYKLYIQTTVGADGAARLNTEGKAALTDLADKLIEFGEFMKEHVVAE